MNKELEMDTAIKLIRVGIIGFGNAGRLIHAPLLAHTPGFVVAAVASGRGDAVREALPDVAVYDDAEAMLASPDLDLIIVATPPDSHAHWAIAALNAGKQVLVEKPFTVTVEEAVAVAEAAIAADRMVSVFHNRRYDSCYLAVRSVMESGILGRILHFESQYNRFDPVVFDAWKEPAAAGSGVWYDLGAHIVDQSIQLFGLPDAVTLTQASNRAECGADDWFHAVLHYPDVRVVLNASFMVAGGVPRFTVHGDQASLVKHQADMQGHHLWAEMSPIAPDYGADNDPPVVIYPDGTTKTQPINAGDFRQFFMALGAAIRGEAPNPTPLNETLAVMAVLEAGIASSRDGRRVAVELPEGGW
jgi:predicted dehydrogenase